MPYGNRKSIQTPYFGTGNPETEELTTLYAPGMLGCIAQFDQGGLAGPENICSYQLVLQDTSQSSILGGVLYWATQAKRGAWTVSQSPTNTGTLAGICQRLVVTAATYIWMLKKGYRSVRLIDAPTSAADTTGKPVVGVTATQDKADVLALTTAPTPFYIGRCLTTQDGTTKLASCLVDIDTYM